MLSAVPFFSAATCVCRTIARRTSGERKCARKLCDFIIGNVSSIATLVKHATIRIIDAADFIDDFRGRRTGDFSPPAQAECPGGKLLVEVVENSEAYRLSSARHYGAFRKNSNAE
jgi:hypothetical protein